MKRSHVFLPKQEHFWSIHTFLKIRKLKKILQTDPHKTLSGIFLSFSVACPHQKRRGTKLLLPQTPQVDSRLAERLRKCQNRMHKQSTS